MNHEQASGQADEAEGIANLGIVMALIALCVDVRIE